MSGEELDQVRAEAEAKVLEDWARTLRILASTTRQRRVNPRTWATDLAARFEMDADERRTRAAGGGR